MLKDGKKPTRTKVRALPPNKFKRAKIRGSVGDGKVKPPMKFDSQVQNNEYVRAVKNKKDREMIFKPFKQGSGRPKVRTTK